AAVGASAPVRLVPGPLLRARGAPAGLRRAEGDRERGGERGRQGGGPRPGGGGRAQRGGRVAAVRGRRVRARGGRMTAPSEVLGAFDRRTRWAIGEALVGLAPELARLTADEVAAFGVVVMGDASGLMRPD